MVHGPYWKAIYVHLVVLNASFDPPIGILVKIGSLRWLERIARRPVHYPVWERPNGHAEESVKLAEDLELEICSTEPG
uniref:Uncharacterized protein n=1 Tax=Anopheles quadriannulatus TaxID=34691 RepID=A0A182XQ57_ANOQN